MNIDDELTHKINLYLRGLLDEKAQKDFEDYITKNSELEELVSILKNMDSVYDEDDWALNINNDLLKASLETFRREDVQAFSKKAALAKQVNEAKQSTLNFKKYLFPVAASIAILFGLFYFSNQTMSLNTAYENYYIQEDLPSFTLKSDFTSHLEEAEALFKSGRYDASLKLFENAFKLDETYNPKIEIYIALCYMELEDYDKAENALTHIEQSNTIDYHKAYWYKAIMYLKQGKLENVNSYLDIIKSDPSFYNHKKAIQLYNEIN